MICKQCKEEGKTSRVMDNGSSTTTLMYCAPYYNEEGKHHSHDYNTVMNSYYCTNGHHWNEKRYNTCPSYDWTNKPIDNDNTTKNIGM